MSLILRYKFDASDPTLDSSGNASHLVNKGGVVSAVDPVHGNVAYFDGSETSILSLDSDFPEALTGSSMAGSSTVSYWFNRDDLSIRILHDDGADPTQRSGPYSMFRSVLNGFQFFVNHGSTVSTVHSGEIPVGTWIHVAYTNDGTTMKVYFNGVMVASAEQPDNTTTSTEALTIGGAVHELHYNYKGYMSDFRVYDYASSESEVLDLYTNAPNPSLLKQATTSKWLTYFLAIVAAVAAWVFFIKK